MIIILTGAGASIVMHWVTVNGPGVSPDSVTYIDTARNLLAGEGFTTRGQPLTHYPPGYPVLLSVFSLFTGGHVVNAARFLAILMFAINGVILGLAVAGFTRYSIPATLCMLAFYLFSVPILSVHLMAWSEAIFIASSISAMVILTLYVDRPRQILLWLASLIASYAMLTRYIGVTLIPPVAFALLILNKRSKKERIKDTLLSSGIMSLPLAIWLLRGVFLAQNPTNRKLAVHLINAEHVTAFTKTLKQFIIPINVGNTTYSRSLIILTVTLSFLLGLVTLIRNDERSPTAPAAKNFILICSVFFLTYLIFLTLSVSFFDAQTPINVRILLPVMLPLTAAAISLVWSLYKIFDQNMIWTSFFFLVLISTTMHASKSIPKAIQIHNHGKGYTSKHWQKSETLQYLEREDTTKKISSNGAEVLFFLTGKKTHMLPQKTNPRTAKANQNYEEQLRKLIRECNEGKALVVYFSGISWRGYLPSLEELESQRDLPVLHRFEDGVIFGISQETRIRNQ